MIKSMTGYGRFEIVDEEKKILVEIKSVNHRYLDINIKMPKKLSFFENKIRNLVNNYIFRGKVDIYITHEDYMKKDMCIKYNSHIANEYMGIFRQISKEHGIENNIRVSELSKYPEVLTLEEETIDEKTIWSMLEETITNALKQFVETRNKEGSQLQEDIMSKLHVLTNNIEQIKKFLPTIISDYKNRLENKIKDFLEDKLIDESRVIAEVTIFADKVSIDEEIVRLLSHIENVKETIIQAENIGRKLDFIAQEMNREANTILSKINNIEISNIAIELKTEIEKIREQIQNIE